METKEIKRILEAEKNFLNDAKKEKLRVSKWALGYCRYASLPFDVMKKTKSEFVIYPKTITDLCNFFGSLTKTDFKNWLKSINLN